MTTVTHLVYYLENSVFFSSPLTSVLICKAHCTFKSRLSKPLLAAHHLRIAFAF